MISHKIVLTAAHCICKLGLDSYGAAQCMRLTIWEKKNIKYVIVGDHDETKIEEPGEQNITITTFLVHDSYDGNNRFSS